MTTVLTACGSTPPEPQSPTVEPSTEHGSFAQCLAEHGIEQPPGPALGPAPGPAAPPPDVDPAAWEQAMAACSELAPGPGP
ncbi:hypothetical protein [Mycobacterium sp. MS1601]|uniref:hypothetical protein n=1 Tax=Mycobacterium sp. MS1601 TaxID=1936029 RepID=UPI0030022A2D